MFVGVLAGIEAASAAPAAIEGLALGKGAIIGAILIAAAFLAGLAVLRKSAAAFSGLLMLAAAGALLAIWLGVAPSPAPTVSFLLQGLFAAAALIFISSTIGMVGRNQLVGGLLFAGALCMAGIGVINAVLGGEASGLLRTGMTAAAAAALLLSALAGARGDLGARLIFPGALLAAAAPLLIGAANGVGVLSLAPQAVFAVGVLMASLAALADIGSQAAVATPHSGAVSRFGDETVHPSRGPAHSDAIALRVSENQLAQVLDYAGVAVWDWNQHGGHQTPSFAALMGAEADGAFTPEAFRDFVHSDDRARFDEKIFGAAKGDGGFDETIRLQNGKPMRFRGARAVDHGGALERIVVFLEQASDTHAATPPQKEDALKLAAATLTGAAVAATKPAPTPEAPGVDIVAAIERGEIAAAFQPIVSFENGKICGAEALVRWPQGGESSERATEEIVRKAQAAGKGRALALIMMKAAAAHVAEHIAAGDKKYFAAFNVSLSQVREEGFVEDVKLAIGDHKLPQGSLVLELTEGERLTETPKIADTFKKLKAAGAALAYDDFGAGFSSLSNLHKYDFDYLKIDKSFIDDIVANGGKKKIVAALARLGRDFGMTVIAEGVESREAAETAKAIGCRMGQGFHLGEPKLKAAPEAGGVGGELTAELATIEVLKPEGGELLLDRSMEAAKPAGRVFRRRLFSRG